MEVLGCAVSIRRLKLPALVLALEESVAVILGQFEKDAFLTFVLPMDGFCAGIRGRDLITSCCLNLYG